MMTMRWRFDTRNTTASFLAFYCTVIIFISTFGSSSSSIVPRNNFEYVEHEPSATHRWITKGDMVAEIPIDSQHLRLESESDRTSESEVMFEKSFFAEDINDIMQASAPSTSTSDKSFWDLYNKLDSGKKAPMYTQSVNQTKPVLTKIRYIYVPILYNDEPSESSFQVGLALDTLITV